MNKNSFGKDKVVEITRKAKITFGGFSGVKRRTFGEIQKVAEQV